ncbi:g425 [Coccomyxa elongata]
MSAGAAHYSDRLSRLQLPKKARGASASAPAAMIRKEQKHIEAAIRESLKDSQPSQPEERAAVSAQASSPRRPNTAGNSSPKYTMVDDTPSTSGGQRKPPVKQSRGRKIVLNSDEESGDSEEDAEAVSDSGSEFSEDEEAESASESDADSSDVADSKEEEDIKPAAKRQKKGAAAQRASVPAQKKAPAAAAKKAPAKSTAQAKGNAANQRAAASCPAATAATKGPAAAAPAAASAGAPRKSPPSKGKAKPLQPSSAPNQLLPPAVAPQKAAASKPSVPEGQVHTPAAHVGRHVSLAKGPAAEALVAAHTTATAPPGPAARTGTPPGTATPVQKVAAAGALKRATPLSGSLKGILASGPQFRVSGLRRAGGIKLHNVGLNKKP